MLSLPRAGYFSSPILVSREVGFFIVRSGEQVRLHEGGDSVLCNTTGGFEDWLLSERKGAVEQSYFCFPGLEFAGFL